MTPLDKARQNQGSRFGRVILPMHYQAYCDNPPKRVFDDKGRRTK
jgi:hypothetical protein